MNYQGVLARKDAVGALCVLWYLVTYHPWLSVGLILCLVATTFWEASVQGGRVIVQLFRGKISNNKVGLLGNPQQGKNYQHNLVMTQTTVEPPPSPLPPKNANDHTEILIEDQHNK